MKIIYDSIGTIYSKHKSREGTPIQSALAADSPGYIKLHPEYVPALKDLEGFSHIILLYHFHLSEGWSPVFWKM